MIETNSFSPESCRELEPLCDKGHVLLVQNQEDGQLYVKKRVITHAPELYHRLQQHPVPGTPAIYAICEEDTEAPAGAAVLTIYEEYLPGHTLAQILADEGPLGEYRTIRIGMELCAILKELHERKPAIIHRDIKPSNVMVLPDGSVRLLDFSAAKFDEAHTSRDTVLIGTAGFAAPEQYGFSSSTAQTDIYSMGVLLNVLRTGHLPWDQLAKGQLRRVIDRCLQIHPADRYPGVDVLRRALNAAKTERLPWLLPGFRTLKWYKMLPAVMFYYLMIVLTLRVDLATGTIPRQSIRDLILQTYLWLMPVVFYGNYLGIQRCFPLMRSRRRWVRLLGLLLAPVWMEFCFMLLYLFTDMVGLP